MTLHSAFRKRRMAEYFRYEAARADEEAAAMEEREHAWAFRAAWACYDGLKTTRAKALAKDYGHYLATAWPRERELWKLPDSVTTKRKALHRFARSRDGSSLGWRAIFDIATIYAADAFETASQIVRIDS